MRKLLAIAAACALAATMATAQTPEPPTMDGMHPVHMDHAAHMAAMARAQRQAEVSVRGKDVMPFSLASTLHVFTKTGDGGLQKVVAREGADAGQILLVRQHLKDIQAQFLHGDFSGPSHIHGAQMPGLAELQSARPGQIAIGYRDVPGGGQLSFAATDAVLVTALHKWFDAQVSDHGKDAMAGHQDE